MGRPDRRFRNFGAASVGPTRGNAKPRVAQAEQGRVEWPCRFRPARVYATRGDRGGVRQPLRRMTTRARQRQEDGSRTGAPTDVVGSASRRRRRGVGEPRERGIGELDGVRGSRAWRASHAARRVSRDVSVEDLTKAGPRSADQAGDLRVRDPGLADRAHHVAVRGPGPRERVGREPGSNRVERDVSELPEQLRYVCDRLRCVDTLPAELGGSKARTPEISDEPRERPPRCFDVQRRRHEVNVVRHQHGRDGFGKRST